MYILPLIGYLGLLLGFSFLTLAIGIPSPCPLPSPFPRPPFLPSLKPSNHPPPHTASGLYYLSELVEEHTVPARRLLTRGIYAIIALHLLLLLVDRFPVRLCALSVASHVVYLGNLRHFPIVKLSDPIFIVSCGSSFPSRLPLELKQSRRKLIRRG
jgi:hypothetical protein